MDTDYPLKRFQFESLMKRLGIPKKEWPAQTAGTGLWLLHKWRSTMRFCCIEVHTDYDYTWNVFWRYSKELEFDQQHLRYSLGVSIFDFHDAIYVSAAAAVGLDVGDSVLSTHTEILSDELQPIELTDQSMTKAESFFAETELNFE